MTKQETIKAIWTPSWHELDQSIAVGVKDKFLFFQENPTLDDCREEYDFVFFNHQDSTDNSVLRFACIAEIYHEILGSLSRVDTDGLDYVFSRINGADILVNAEEQPGATYDDRYQVDEWSVIVTLTEVSEPIDDVV